MNPTFSIVIVTWNGLHHLQTFLPSVAETDHSSFEIVIADNASNDDTVAWIRKQIPQCRIVTFDRNHGYCGGNNRAAAYCRGEILVFLNNDVRVEPNWLSELEKPFADDQASVVQPKIRSYTEPEKFEYAGASGGFIDRMGYPFCRGRLFETVEEDAGQYDEAIPVFWASGAALAIRRDLFDRLGGFDESFEFHMEEIDLCWRAWRYGHKVMVEPRSVVYHLGGGSMPMGSTRKVYYNYRNSLLMLTKNHQHSSLLPAIFLRLCLDGVAGLRSLLQLKPEETWAVIRAHFGYYRRLPEALRKRKKLAAEADSEPPAQTVHSRLIIIDYFLKGVRRFSELY
ncbi:MAG: glycosyltransferase family 2 protein [Balneolaceae bacterium]